MTKLCSAVLCIFNIQALNSSYFYLLKILTTKRYATRSTRRGAQDCAFDFLRVLRGVSLYFDGQSKPRIIIITADMAKPCANEWSSVPGLEFCI